MPITSEERDIIRRILAMDEQKTTDVLESTMLNPVTNYSDPAQLEREIEVLFRRFPLILAHSSELAEPGSFVTHDDTGVPILVTRTIDGELMAYLNVCRHRGARLASEPCGKARTLTCPYHAWTYGLDGSLRGMPHPSGFDQIDRREFGLVELPVYERFGLVWVVPTRRDVIGDIDIDAWLAPMAEHLDGLDLANHVIFEKWSLDRKMSWRFAIEGFQESYHFCSAHRHTACSNYLDNRSIFIDCDPHVRHAVPLPRTLDMRELPESEWEYRMNFMTQNYLFPANFVQTMTDHVYVHTIIPTGAGTCVFQCTMLVPEAPATDKADRYWRANYDVVRTVFDEDFAIGEGIQRGLASGANEHFVFGTFECGLHLGQNAIDRALGGALVAPAR